MTYRLADDRSAMRVRLTSAIDTVKLSESPSGLLHRVDVFAWMFRRARSISSTSNTRYRRLKSNIFGKRLIYEIKGAYLFFRRNSSIECLNKGLFEKPYPYWKWPLWYTHFVTSKVHPGHKESVPRWCKSNHKGRSQNLGWGTRSETTPSAECWGRWCRCTLGSWVRCRYNQCNPEFSQQLQTNTYSLPTTFWRNVGP